MKREGKVKGCVFCKSPADTREHVPPKCFFKKGATQLITVPCCLACNRGKSQDDEYLAHRLGMSIHDKYAAEYDEIIRRSVRAMGKPEAKQYREHFLASLSEEHRFDHGGFYSSTETAMGIDMIRADRTIAAIAIGMMHHVFPNNFFGTVTQSRFLYPPQLDLTRPDVVEVLRGFDQVFTQHFDKRPRKSVGGLTFRYDHTSLEKTQWGLSCIWVFEFYGTHEWIGTVSLEDSSTLIG